ncbi:patatin-like phospholipase family protein [Tenacibaculum amylolyticum]|uniref:patatin-like phospholipase family protein n=1 Tax=Tenacibaculum amylolyticum TaxID=104269 RepID=UPI00389581B6
MKKRLLCILLLIPFLIFSQEKPKVGLVLSGGGAKGFAHIGILKEIEKSGIQLDYIGGTSMGAIVGGLYASGYSAAQIEKIVLDIDLLAIIQDNVAREEKSYFEKAYLGKTAITLPVKKGNIGLPLGLSKGQNVLNLLTELLSPVDSITNFSKLPIPFFCIGTDIETGEEVVLQNGSLPLALRASASFPTLLNPVEIGGRLIVDGGVANNFPVDVMEKKGMDVIIGVNVQGKLLKRDKLTSVASLLSQIVNFQMYRKSDEQVKKLDIHIHPDINDYTVVSFNEKEEILREGEKAVKPYRSVFKKIAELQKNDEEKVKKVINPLANNKKFLIDRIILKGNKKYTENYILGKLRLKEGDTVSYKEISKKINALSATRNFQRVDYSLEESFEGKKLLLAIKENDIKTFLSFGLHYDGLYKTGVLVNYNHKNVFFGNDELSLDVVIGDKIRYDLQYFIDNGYLLSYGFTSRYNAFETDVLFNENNLNKINVRYRDFTNRIFAQTTFSKKTAFGAGVELKSLKISSETFLTNDEETLFDQSVYFNPFAFLHIDTHDKRVLPTKGFSLNTRFRWFLLSNRNDRLNEFATGSIGFKQYSQIDGRFSFATTFWDKFTFQNVIETGFTLGEEDSEIFDYRLGGYNKNYIDNFVSFYGYDISSLSEQSFLKSEFHLRYQLFKKQYAVFIANYGRVGKNVLKRGELLKDTKSGYALGYSIETILGPIELKYTWSPDHKERYWLFNLGFWF